MFAVANFGHFWRRDGVKFGKPGEGNAGSLVGFFGSLRNPARVEFEDQIGVYVLYTDDREVIYVGQPGSGSKRLLSRLRTHTRDHLRDRWTYVSWFGLRQHNTSELYRPNVIGRLSDKQKPETKFSGTNSDALDELEAVLIQLFEPRLNRRNSKWKDAQEFRQWDDSFDSADEDDEEE